MGPKFKRMSSSWIQLPGDKNVTWKIEEKENTYGPLLRNLQILYPEYSYQFFPVIIGALSSIPCDLKYNLKCLDFFCKRSKQTNQNASNQKYYWFSENSEIIFEI